MFTFCAQSAMIKFCRPILLLCLQQDRAILTALVLSETDLMPAFTVIFGRTVPLTRAGLKHWSASLSQGQGHISASGTRVLMHLSPQAGLSVLSVETSHLAQGLQISLRTQAKAKTCCILGSKIMILQIVSAQFYLTVTVNRLHCEVGGGGVVKGRGKRVRTLNYV